MRKLGKPPFLIMLIMDCVLIYFKRKLEPVKVDPERGFLFSSWTESLKVNWKKVIFAFTRLTIAFQFQNYYLNDNEEIKPLPEIYSLRLNRF